MRHLFLHDSTYFLVAVTIYMCKKNKGGWILYVMYSDFILYFVYFIHPTNQINQSINISTI